MKRYFIFSLVISALFITSMTAYAQSQLIFLENKKDGDFSIFAIPEFGTIAALILAVAIISIIVVSSRTRLTVLQKY